jgi:hypothetical protein
MGKRQPASGPACARCARSLRGPCPSLIHARRRLRVDGRGAILPTEAFCVRTASFGPSDSLACAIAPAPSTERFYHSISCRWAPSLGVALAPGTYPGFAGGATAAPRSAMCRASRLLARHGACARGGCARTRAGREENCHAQTSSLNISRSEVPARHSCFGEPPLALGAGSQALARALRWEARRQLSQAGRPRQRHRRFLRTHAAARCGGGWRPTSAARHC